MWMLFGSARCRFQCLVGNAQCLHLLGLSPTFLKLLSTMQLARFCTNDEWFFLDALHTRAGGGKKRFHSWFLLPHAQLSFLPGVILSEVLQTVGWWRHLLLQLRLYFEFLRGVCRSSLLGDTILFINDLLDE